MLSLTFCLADRASEGFEYCWKVLNLHHSILLLIVVVEHHLVSLHNFLLQLELSGNFCCLIEFGCHR